MIPRHFFSRWLTSQDGRLWNCVRQGSIVITDIPYTTAPLMDLPSVEAMTFTLSTTPHPVGVPLPTLAGSTAHQAGTAMEAPSPGHFWKEEVMIILHQTKWKHFTKQPKNCGIEFSFKLYSQLILNWLSQNNNFFISIGNSMICSGIYAKYHLQMLLIIYTTNLRRFVIFTCRYFKLSWNTTALSQSNCRNFSCSSINKAIKKK